MSCLQSITVHLDSPFTNNICIVDVEGQVARYHPEQTEYINKDITIVTHNN